MVVPLCRCRVLYIGSAVPTITKDGLQGIQQPLRERYPIEDAADTKGIDSWLSVWSNGVLLEYIDGEKKSETAFHPINTLHYCAAVRYVNVSGYAVEGGGERFLPLDSPFANLPDSPHPPMFAAIFRRTTGIKVLECHAFICTNVKAANALVRCCFHAYADSIYLKMDDKIPGLKAIKEASRSASPHSELANSVEEERTSEKMRWSEKAIGKQTWERRQQSGDYETASISSSMAGKYRSKGPRESPQEMTGKNGALVPYTNGPRRAGSDFELYQGGPPPPMPGGHFFGPHPPPPPHFHPHFPPPPFIHPAMMRPPFFGRLPPPPPPHMMPPPFGMMPPPHAGMRMHPPPPPPPPFFHPGMPPHPMFFGPYGPPPHMAARPRTPPEGDGPIIEAVYGTLPSRGRAGRAFEEPIYMPGNVAPGQPPHASYHPASYPPDQYDAYMDTYKRHRSPQTKHKVNGSMSHRSGDEGTSNQFWDSYEAGIYRKPHINEKAFGSSVRSENAASGHAGGQVTTTQADVVRPDTPPVDYDAAFDQMHIAGGQQSSTKTAQQTGRTAVY